MISRSLCKLCQRRRKISFQITSFSSSRNSHQTFETEFVKTHVESSGFQKVLLSLGAATISLLNPRRGDLIAVLSETTGQYALPDVLNKMGDSAEGRRILDDKPRINSRTVDLKALADLPPGTLGRAYSDFLKDNKVTPDTRGPVQFVDDVELAYVIQRYREVHDLFHTILQMPTTMLGEVTVKWVEGIQTKLPMCYGGGLFGAVRLAPKFHTQQRNYSTKRKVSIDFAAELVEGIESKSIKAKHHPGVMHVPHPSVPKFIQDRIKNALRHEQIPQLLKESKDFKNHLQSRRLPPDAETIKNIAVNAQEKFKYKHPIDLSNAPEEAKRLYQQKQESFVKKNLKEKIYNWKPIKFNEHTSYKYLVTRSAEEYAVLYKILHEIVKRDPNFKPKTLFDFGSGVGTVLWAAHHFWKSSIQEYFCVDSSSDMHNLASCIIYNGDENHNKPFLKHLYQRQFFPAIDRSYDIVFSAFTLMEIDSNESRCEMLTKLWRKTSNYLVLVEQGNNAGFELINEARDYILHYSRSCYVLAPCPHEYTCPRVDDTPCNFPISYYNLELKEPVHQPSYGLYSYVVIKKGERPEEDPQWSRIVREILIRSKHNVCRLCTSKGNLEEIVFTKAKHGIGAFQCSKKSNWGDLLPGEVKEVTNDENEEK